VSLAEYAARVRIDHAPVDGLSFEQVVDAIVSHAAARQPASYVVTPNAQHVAMLYSDARLRAAYEGAWLSVPDGVSLLWAARLLGRRFQGRVNGTDLLEALCARAAKAELTIFLLGGRAGTAERSAVLLVSRYPGLDVRTLCPPFGFERDAAEQASVVRVVRSAAPHLLFIGLGAPRQEYWMHEHHAQLGVPVLLGIGGSFELVSGMLPRAPVWMQKAGLEWFFRLRAEPRRLLRRYATTIPVFVGLVLRQFLRERLLRRPPP
jgi:N-acetylglucosaminyldiphosphoundecaprenol N-acetyl-beta-D-mannosaminyltransferase